MTGYEVELANYVLAHPELRKGLDSVTEVLMAMELDDEFYDAVLDAIEKDEDIDFEKYPTLVADADDAADDLAKADAYAEFDAENNEAHLPEGLVDSADKLIDKFTNPLNVDTVDWITDQNTADNADSEEDLPHDKVSDKSKKEVKKDKSNDCGNCTNSIAKHLTNHKW